VTALSAVVFRYSGHIGALLSPTRIYIVYVAITDKIYVKNHRQIASQLETSIPKSAFAGATLDLLYTGQGLEKLDTATRDRVLEFAEDFLNCGCQDNPYCGHPERKFIQYILQLRAEGHGPDAVVDVMTDEYMVYAYPGDILSFLDNAVRKLEAVESLAEVDGDTEMAEKARNARRALAG
jgi:Superfamily II helicase, archaea-specific